MTLGISGKDKKKKVTIAVEHSTIEETVNSVDGMLRCEVSKFNTKELYYSRMVQSLANDDDTLHAGMLQGKTVSRLFMYQDYGQSSITIAEIR